MKHSPTTYQAGIRQASVARSLQRHCDEILQPFGVTKAQWFVIGLVWDAGEAGISITELAARLGTGLAYITNAVNLLESKGFVVKSNHDRDGRAKVVSLAAGQIERCEVIEAGLRKSLQASIYAKIDPVEFKTYLKVMYQLADVG